MQVPLKKTCTTSQKLLSWLCPLNQHFWWCHCVSCCQMENTAISPVSIQSLTKTRNASVCVGKQPIMVATASTEHSYWLALAFVAWTQAIAFEWKPGYTLWYMLLSNCSYYLQQIGYFFASVYLPVGLSVNKTHGRSQSGILGARGSVNTVASSEMLVQGAQDAYIVRPTNSSH